MNESVRGSSDELRLMREMRAQLAAVTGGIAPDDYVQAWWDWYLNLAREPQKQAEIARTSAQVIADQFQFAMKAATGQPLTPSADDKRFTGAAWSQWPFNVAARGYLNWTQVMQQATSGVPGLSPRSDSLVKFSAKQFVDVVSPANSLFSNPELLEVTRAQSGRNLIEGFKNWLEDVDRTLTHKRPPGSHDFEVGGTVAVTPGKVVYRNALIEIMQYGATTQSVYAEPIFIVPAWIMKYYILDLSPENSLVRYLVGQGHTVFIISWKNPNETDRDLGMDDYYHQGILEGLNVVGAIVPNVKIHAVGYCIGGTLLSIAAAALARQGDHRLGTITLLAAQTDFSEPGELSLFISPSQLAMLEAVMHKNGTLSSEQMGASFALLRANDLLWKPSMDTYVKGTRQKLNDLMAWNGDGTRMPWRMHSEYLSRLYLQNDLAGDRFQVDGQPISLGSITTPLFALGTETDHVAPWKSAFKTRGLTRSPDYTFALTSGGHNAGIVCGAVNPKRRFRAMTWQDDETICTPEQWLEQATLHEGSWWPFWQRWLADHSAAEQVTAPDLGNASAGFGILGDAPGDYVRQR